MFSSFYIDFLLMFISALMFNKNIHIVLLSFQLIIHCKYFKYYFLLYLIFIVSIFMDVCIVPRQQIIESTFPQMLKLLIFCCLTLKPIQDSLVGLFAYTFSIYVVMKAQAPRMNVVVLGSQIKQLVCYMALFKG